MGLFGKRPAAAAAAPKATPPKSDDPLVALVGLSVNEAAYEDGTLTITFKGAGGEAHLEAYGRAFLAERGVPSIAGTPPFKALLKSVPGRKVVATALRVGDTLTVELEGGLTAVASLRAGDYAGEAAVYLKGPGKSYVNFNENGFARLAL